MNLFGKVKLKDISSHNSGYKVLKIKDAPKCAICGKPYYDSSLYVMYRMKSQIYNLDGKPTEFYNSHILECPNCHYCNYKLNELVDLSYMDMKPKKRIEAWKRHSSQFIEEKNDELRKILILESQYGYSIEDAFKRMHLLLQASWVCDDDRTLEFRNKAIDTYYRSLNEFGNYSIMIADTLRQNSDFERAESILNSLPELKLYESKYNAEKELIKNKDNSPHTEYEVKEKYKQETSQ